MADNNRLCGIEYRGHVRKGYEAFWERETDWDGMSQQRIGQNCFDSDR